RPSAISGFTSPSMFSAHCAASFGSNCLILLSTGSWLHANKANRGSKITKQEINLLLITFLFESFFILNYWFFTITYSSPSLRVARKLTRSLISLLVIKFFISGMLDGALFLFTMLDL